MAKPPIVVNTILMMAYRRNLFGCNKSPFVSCKLCPVGVKSYKNSRTDLSASLVVIIMGGPLFGFDLEYPLYFALDILGGTLMLCAFASVFTFISMVVSNKASSVAACLIVYALLFGMANFLRIPYIQL